MHDVIPITIHLISRASPHDISFAGKFSRAVARVRRSFRCRFCLDILARGSALDRFSENFLKSYIFEYKSVLRIREWVVFIVIIIIVMYDSQGLLCWGYDILVGMIRVYSVLGDYHIAYSTICFACRRKRHMATLRAPLGIRIYFHFESDPNK